MARKSKHNLPPGIQFDQHRAYWATLEGDDAKLRRKRYPGKSLPPIARMADRPAHDRSDAHSAGGQAG